jgi:subtilase family serine protease
MQLVLTRSSGQEADLKELLEAQQDAHSPGYHQWLTPEEFGKRFGVAESDIAVVVSWLNSHGFRVDKVGKGRTVIEFSGVAGQVKSAFHTEIHKYVIGGEEHWANASDQQIPEALAPVVAGVAALHDFKAKPLIRVGGKIAAVRDTASPSPKYDFSPGVYALAPADFATIYNVNPLYAAGIDGTGVVIGVIGVDGFEGDSFSRCTKSVHNGVYEGGNESGAAKRQLADERRSSGSQLSKGTQA